MKSNDFLVSWHYSYIDASPIYDKKTGKQLTNRFGEPQMTAPKRVTICKISKRNPSGKQEESDVITTGTVTCHINDKDSKDEARKASMKLAISLGQECNVIPRGKQIRADFWESYRTMTPNPRWNIKPISVRKAKLMGA